VPAYLGLECGAHRDANVYEYLTRLLREVTVHVDNTGLPRMDDDDDTHPRFKKSPELMIAFRLVMSTWKDGISYLAREMEYFWEQAIERPHVDHFTRLKVSKQYAETLQQDLAAWSMDMHGLLTPDQDQSGRRAMDELKDQLGQILAYKQEIGDTFQLLIGAIAIKDSEIQKEIAQESRLQARRSSALTALAAIYLPLSLTTGVFGMNVVEIEEGKPKCWAALAVAIGLLVVTLPFLVWVYLDKDDTGQKLGEPKVPGEHPVDSERRPLETNDGVLRTDHSHSFDAKPPDSVRRRTTRRSQMTRAITGVSRPGSIRKAARPEHMVQQRQLEIEVYIVALGVLFSHNYERLQQRKAADMSYMHVVWLTFSEFPTICKPLRTFLSKLPNRFLFVQLHIICAEHIFPPPITAFVNEGIGAIFESIFRLWRADFDRMSLHVVESTMLRDLIQRRVADFDVQELCDPLDLATQVGLQVVEVDKEQVRQVSRRVPAPNCPPKRQSDRFLLVVLENVKEVLPGVRWRLQQGRSYTAGSVVDQLIEQRRGMVHVIVQAPERISAITRHEDIFCLRAEDKVLKGQVRFDEAAVLLRFQHPNHGFQGNGTEVEPGRCYIDGSFFGALEHELRDDLLHPSRSRFAPAGDDDVVRSELEVVPSC